MACAAWSSLIMNRMLGRAAAPPARGIATEARAVNVTGSQFFMAGIVRNTSAGAIVKRHPSELLRNIFGTPTEQLRNKSQPCGLPHACPALDLRLANVAIGPTSLSEGRGYHCSSRRR